MNGNLSRAIDSHVGLVICFVLHWVSRLRGLLGGPRQPGMRSTTPPSRGRAPARPRRILCIKTYGLGNIAMLLPVLDAAKRGFPGVEIDFLTLGENRSLLEHSRLVRKVIPLSTDDSGSLVRSLMNAYRVVRREKYDVVLDFEQFIKLSTIFAYLSGAPERIGFNTDGQRRGWLFTTRVVYSDNEHMSRTFMRLLRPLQIDTSFQKVEFHYSEDERARAAALLAENGVVEGHYPLIAVHVGSGPNFYRLPLKRWPTEKFAQLCDGLVERYGARIVFTGKGEEEAALVRETLSQMKHAGVNACDALSIAELLVLLERVNLTISNDTSVIHLSAAVRTPVATFFGPTNPLQYGPGNPDDLVIYQDVFCGPCLTNYNLKVSHCSDPVCIRTITVDQVLDELDQKYLSETATSGRAVGNASARPKAKLEVLEG
jgi:heptosyltransferase-3